MRDPILSIKGLTKRFGALAAVDDVFLDFASGETHAIIGPNGAGKTTLINLLSGDLPPTTGTIHLLDRDVTALAPDRKSQLGIGRTYQKTNIFPDETCFQNCWLAAQSRLPSSMRFFRRAHRRADIRAATERALALCNLDARADVIAGHLSYGEQRQLEIGMTLATDPKILLLDEPLAGMSAEESVRTMALLTSLAENLTLILIEHDMDMVFAFAQTITVMVNGQVLETGTPAQIRASAAVRDAYLGHGPTEQGATP
ncbi:MAG: ABC transporter ATP-binding protein [Alphaproteobacteria bacterium]|nr:ABC transporter ATP-binding protein [Alphaproteobacteria bacterium]